MLKRKEELNYRKATERFRRCRYCSHRKWTAIQDPANGTSAAFHDWRCEEELGELAVFGREDVFYSNRVAHYKMNKEMRYALTELLRRRLHHA